MTWLFENPFERRPIVIVEDHLNHLDDICEQLQADQPGLFRLITLVGLDAGGPDTRQDVNRWLRIYPEVKVAAHLASEDAQQLVGQFPDRLLPIPSELLKSSGPIGLSELLAGLVRPGGFLLQDVQLDNLHFIPADRKWESIRLLTTQVRALIPGRPSVVWFMSNKSNPFHEVYGALTGLNFDPNHFLDKDDLARRVISVFLEFLEESMPFSLRVTQDDGAIYETAVGEEDLLDVMNGVDLALWQTDTALRLGGRLIKGDVLDRKVDSAEGRAWQALVVDRFGERTGVETKRFGELKAPKELDERYDSIEINGWGSRLAWGLRSLLQAVDPKTLIETRDGTYRLSDRLQVGWVVRNFLTD